MDSNLSKIARKYLPDEPLKAAAPKSEIRPVRIIAPADLNVKIDNGIADAAAKTNKVDLKSKLYSPLAAAEVDRIVAENEANWGAFDPAKLEALITDHPIFSLLHLAYNSEE